MPAYRPFSIQHLEVKWFNTAKFLRCGHPGWYRLASIGYVYARQKTLDIEMGLHLFGRMTKSIDQMDFLRFQNRLEGRKGEIIKAAFDCIFEVGIAASSTHVIAAKANLNQGAIHYYFNSKDDLLKSVVEVFFRNSTSNIEAIAESGLPAQKKLRMILRAGLSLIGPRSREFIVFIALWSHAVSVGGDMLTLYRNLFVSFRTAITAVIREGESQGIFRSGASEDLALLIVGAVEGIGIQFVLDPESLDPQSVVELLESIIEKSAR